MKPLVISAGGQVEALLGALQIPLFLSGTLGVRAGANIDGVLIGMLSPTPIGQAWAANTGGTVFVDETAAANNATANDMNLLPAVPVANDCYYLGHLTKKFCAAKLVIGTQANTPVMTIEVQYWKVAGWTNLATSNLLVDDTAGLTAAPGTYFITFKPPSDWVTNDVNGVTAYYIRIIATAFTSIVAPPLGTQAWLYALGLPGAASGTGVPFPIAGTITKAHFNAGTLSATNNDSVFLIANLTSGDYRLAIFTKGTAFVVTTLSPALTINLGDQIAVMMLKEDGSTEFADVTMFLELAI